MKTHVRFWLAVVVVCLGIITTACATPPTPTVTLPTAPPTPTRRPPTTVPPTPTPAPEGDPAPEGFAEALDAAKPVGAEALTLLYQIGDDGAKALATYEITNFWTMTGALRDCVSSFIGTAPIAFDTDAELEAFQAVYLVTMYDEDRNESLEPLLTVMVTRNTANGVDWANLKRCDLPDAVESVEVYPSEAESWDRMCAP